MAVLCRNRVVAEALGQALSRAGTEPFFFAAPADLPVLLARAELTPDVLVIVEPDAEVAAATALAVRERWPRTKLIAAGLALAADVTPALIVAGIVGVVLAPEPLGALRSAIRRVLRGELCASPSVHRALLERVLHENGAVDPRQDQSESLPDRLSLLSSREEQIFRLLSSVSATANKDIARELGLEVQTVKNHVRSIYRKLGISRRADIGPLATAEGES